MGLKSGLSSHCLTDISTRFAFDCIAWRQSGVKMTRLIGIAGEGVDCTASATGKVTFLAGRVPIAGELVTVTYRGQQRAVARMEDAASVAAETSAGVPGTAQWLG